MDRLEGILRNEPQDAVNIVISTLQAQSGIGEIASLVARFTRGGSLYKSDLSHNERVALMDLIKKMSGELERMQDSLEEAKDFPEPVSLSKIWVK